MFLSRTWILHLPMCILHLPLFSKNIIILLMKFSVPISHFPTLTPLFSLLSTRDSISLDGTPTVTTPLPPLTTPPSHHPLILAHPHPPFSFCEAKMLSEWPFQKQKILSKWSFKLLMEWLFRKHFCLRKGHSGSSFFKSGLAFLEVYFVYSGKGILEIIIVLTESPFQKQQLQSRVAFSEVYFVSSEKGIPEKLYFSLWKNHFGSNNCNLK